MKMFKNKSRSSMRDMVKFYSTMLMIVISSFGILISVFITKQVQRDAITEVTETSKAVGYMLNYYQNEVRRITYTLFSNTDETQDLNYYFLNDFNAYNLKNLFGEYIYFPKKISNLYIEYEDLEGITISLKNVPDVYVSTEENRFGRKYEYMFEIEDTIQFTQVLINHISYEVLGYVNLHVDIAAIENQISQSKTNLVPGVIITNEFGRVVYQSTPNIEYFDMDIDEVYQDMTQSSYTMKEQDYGDFRVFTYMPESLVMKKAFSSYFWIVLGAFILDIILVYLLNNTFGKYSDQVSDILECITKVKDGDYDYRIDLKDKGTELYDISLGINEMLNSITDYIETIYQLEIKQRDINLMALQAQINPHFLYNTLEFIRMYAVSEGVDELAEIVYAFSELLRNNISLERETTLEEEVEFTKNYIYLYQMRYPNRLAYKVSIQEDLKNFMLPKFTLQPLIENYVKHGVDFNRIDNAIRISVFSQANKIYIQIIDNGRGADESKLHEIKNRLSVNEIDIKSDTSIGLYNVHERLKAYFKEAYMINVESGINEGFKIEIIIDTSKEGVKSKWKHWGEGND